MEAALVGPLGRTALGAMRITLGRASDNTVVVNDLKASSHHAEIRPEGQYYSLVDLGSMNGTFVNEQQVYSGTPRPLQSGDTIRIGDTRFSFETSNTSQSPYLEGSTLRAAPPPPVMPNYSGNTSYGGNYGSQPNYPPVEFPQAQFSAPAYSDPYNMPPTQQSPYGSETQTPTYVSPSYNQTGPQPNYMQQPPTQPPDYMQQSQTQPPPAVYTTQTQPKPKPSRVRWIVLAVIALVVILAAVGGFLIYQNGQSTPTKTVDAFCSNLQNKDYQDAYNLIAVDYQAKYPEPTFKTYFSSVTSCAHSSVTTSNGNTLSTLTLAPASTYPWTYQLTLVKDSGGNWKIDSFLSAPDLALASFCSNIQSKNFQDAYNLLTPSFQTNYSESNFTQYFSSATSCTNTPVAESNGVTSSTLTLAPDTSYPWTYQLTLAKDSSGNWKIDQFTSAPDLALDTFCNDVQKQNYQDAYNLTSTNYQSSVSEQTFQSALSSATSCTHDLTTVANNATTSTVTFGPSSSYAWSFQATLLKDSSGNWKVDNFVALPDLTVDKFCTDIGNQNLTDAYSLTSAGFQNNISETQFASNLAPATSCKAASVTFSNGSVSSTITYQLNDGTTARQIATLVKDTNGDWKIDSLKNA